MRCRRLKGALKLPANKLWHQITAWSRLADSWAKCSWRCAVS